MFDFDKPDLLNASNMYHEHKLEENQSDGNLEDAIKRLKLFRMSWDDEEVIDKSSRLRAVDLDTIIETLSRL